MCQVFFKLRGIFGSDVPCCRLLSRLLLCRSRPPVSLPIISCFRVLNNANPVVSFAGVLFLTSFAVRLWFASPSLLYVTPPQNIPTSPFVSHIPHLPDRSTPQLLITCCMHRFHLPPYANLVDRLLMQLLLCLSFVSVLTPFCATSGSVAALVRCLYASNSDLVDQVPSPISLRSLCSAPGASSLSRIPLHFCVPCSIPSSPLRVWFC